MRPCLLCLGLVAACAAFAAQATSPATTSPATTSAAAPAAGASAAVTAASAPADEGALQTLRRFVRGVHAATAHFVQTVIAPQTGKARVSSGRLAFMRPDRFRFDYERPFAQVLVGDGKQIWTYDADLNQVSVRPMGRALAATPAALVTGEDLDKDFTLRALAPHEGLQWIEAIPRSKDGQFQSIRLAFRDGQPARLEVLDSFGQTTTLELSDFHASTSLPAATFEFKPPAGADVIRQP
jgi:outer membrane lipoprotein carrier protein